MKININGIVYDYNVYGNGFPLLLLHGFTGSQATWDPFLDLLSNQFKVITIDLPGHGKTESPNDLKFYKMESVVNSIDFLLQKLDIESVNMLGYSMGGRVALSFACQKPQRVNKLILESSSPGLKSSLERETRKKADFLLAQKILNDGIEAFVKEWEEIPLFRTQKNLPQPIIDKIRKERLSQNKIGLANSLLGMGTGSQPSWWEHLQTIEIPVKIIVGELDEKFVNIGEQMARKLKNASLSKVLGCGHAIHVEDSQKFGKIVMEFLLY